MRKREGNLLRKIMAIFLAALLAVGTAQGAVPSKVLAAEGDILASAEGWTLYADGRMIISSDVAYPMAYTSYNSNKDKVISVEIQDNVTAIIYSIFNGCTNLTEVTIPDSVTSIGDNVFANCSSLKEITIPASVESIGREAFKWCGSLTKVTMHRETPPTLGSGVFDKCAFVEQKTKGIHVPNGKKSDYTTAWTSYADYITDTEIISTGTDWTIRYDGKLTIRSNNGMTDWTNNGRTAHGEAVRSAEIADGVTSIAANAFENCAGMTSVTIPSGVTSIGESAFSGCSELAEAALPESVTEIAQHAFYGCRNLTEITIPDSVTAIGNQAFTNCSSLVKVTMLKDAAPTIGENVFMGCGFADQMTKGIRVPDNKANDYKTAWTNYADYITDTNITGSGTDWTFDFDGKLIISSDTGMTGWAETRKKTNTIVGNRVKSVEIKSGVTNIADSAFASCINLTSVTIPDSVTTIGKYAFSGCTKLPEIPIPQKVTEIGEYAFWECYSLKEITIPEGITEIGQYTFNRCIGLTEISIPSGVTTIGEHAFGGCSSLKEITIPEGVTEIKKSTFDNCESLMNVTIPSGVTTIGEAAFRLCSELKTIKLPDGLTTIGQQAFYQCNDMTEITIPSGVETIGYATFMNCYGLTEVMIPSGVTTIDNSAFLNCLHLEDVTISASVESIGEQAFAYCAGLKKVMMLRETPPTLGEKVFDRSACVADGKKGIFVPEGKVDDYKAAWPAYADHIADGMGSGTGWAMKLDGTLVIESDEGMDDWLKTGIREYQSQVTSAEILDGVTEIDMYAFYECKNMTDVTIPSSVKYIGHAAFDSCENLTNVKGMSGVTSIDDYAFQNCSMLPDITIPASVTKIGNSAFYQCGSLTSVTIPEGVKEIGESVFYGCSSLANITLPSDLTSIGYSAFYGCGMTGIEIPSGVTRIGASAFQNCSKLKDIEIPSGVESIGLNAFYSCTSLTDIEIPSGVTEIEQNVFAHCRSLTSVTGMSGVTSIGDYAFNCCESLKEITIPSGVTNIGNYAFCSCESLKEITIPSGVTDIGGFAFAQCSELAKVTSLGKKPPTLSYDIFDNSKFVMENVPGSIHVPEGRLEEYKRYWSDWKDYIVDDVEDIFEGAGTEEEPYLIASKADLEKLRGLVNGGETFAGVYFKVTADIDLTGDVDHQWTPIGTQEHPFKGILDGDSHTVSGLYINDANKNNQGLFGTNEGTIKNLTVQGTVTGGDNTAGIAGTNKGTIENCTNEAKVTGKDNMGGIAGTNSGTVKDCTNKGVIQGSNNVGGITGSNTGNVNGSDNAGNVSGQNNVGGITGSNTGNINGSDNAGSISGQNNVGGIAGNNGGTGTVNDSANSGNVTGTGTGAGGVAGTNDGALTNNTNTAAVTGKDDIGGIAGTNGENGTVEGCANSGNVTKAEGGTGTPGAIIGNNQNTSVDAVKDDYYQKTDTVNKDITGIGEGTGAGTDPEGITSGQTPMPPAAFEGSGTPEDPYRINNKADIEKLRDLVNGGEAYAGVYFKVTVDIDLTGDVDHQWTPIGTQEHPFKGILDGDSHTVSGLYINDVNKNNQGLFGTNEGTIKNLIVQGEVTGGDNTAGIAGTNKGIIENCTNEASVTGKDNVGGIAGKNDGTLTNNTNTAAVTGKDDIGGIAGTNGENGTVEGCANSGNVTKSEGGTGTTGAIIGNNQNTNPDAVKDDYYQKTDTVNKDITGIGEGTGAGTDPEGITSGETPTKPGQGPSEADRTAAKAFEDEKIAAIGQAAPVGGEAWKKAVKDAGEAFDGLTENQKNLVSEDAKKILTDAKAILGAVEKIEFIGTVANTPESAKKIKDARDAYDGLTNEQKAKVPENVKKTLTDAEEAYKALTAGAGGNQNNNLTEEQKKQVQTIAKELGVSEETAAKIQKIAEELGIPAETLLLGDGAFTSQNSENDIKGSLFSQLQLKASKVSTNSVKLTWKKVKGADGYQIYGAQCLKGNKLKLIKTIEKGSTKTYTQKKLKKGKAYRYVVRAYKIIDGKRVTIAASKSVHIFTNGGKYGNAKSVKVNKTKANIKKGKKFKIKASEVKAKKPIRRHRKLSYESSNTKVATVTKKGVIKAKAKGKCTVYIYAQNGVYKKIKVTVK